MKLFSKSVTALTLGLTLAFAQNAFATETLTLTPEQVLSQQLVDATVWKQTSAEARAISYQNFYLAKLAFDAAKVPAGKLKAVIVDLDETMINNTAYMAALIKHGKGITWKAWGDWEKSEQATALPGAVEFAKYVTEHGGRMYYVSNRSEANLAWTEATLTKLGFPGVSDDTVLLEAETGQKDPRFAKVASHKDVQVVLWCGDNLYDLPGAYVNRSLEARNRFVDDNKNNFGVKYIVFSNPMYGSFINQLTPHYSSHTADERLQIAIDSLKAWDGLSAAQGK